MASIREPAAGNRLRGLRDNFLNNKALYFMAVPSVIFFVMIRIVPVLGSVIAWQDYSIFRGILASPWVGWDNFREMFAYPGFYRVLSNTMLIGFYRVVIGFPVPIILALILNEVKLKRFQSVAQSALYLPYFLSWVVVGQLFMNMLHPSTGIVNILLIRLGLEPVFFFGEPQYFHALVTVSYIWKFAGYQSIIYLAAISTVDPNLYEAAEIDGAGPLVKIFRITIPIIAPVIIIMMLLSIGQFMEIGFDQIYVMMNPLVRSTADIFDTYIYRVGLVNGRFSITTAIGLFKSLVGFVLIIGGNFIAQKWLGRGFFA